MTEDFDKMARIEREIEKRMESACEKDGWVVSVAMMPPKSTTLHIEKFGENKIDLLICGGIGGGAMAALAEAGVEVVGGVSGDAKAAVESYLARTLAPRADFQCNHHHHEAGQSCGGSHEGHTCGGHCH